MINSESFANEISEYFKSKNLSNDDFYYNHLIENVDMTSSIEYNHYSYMIYFWRIVNNKTSLGLDIYYTSDIEICKVIYTNNDDDEICTCFCDLTSLKSTIDKLIDGTLNTYEFKLTETL